MEKKRKTIYSNTKAAIAKRRQRRNKKLGIAVKPGRPKQSETKKKKEADKIRSLYKEVGRRLMKQEVKVEEEPAPAQSVACVSHALEDKVKELPNIKIEPDFEESVSTSITSEFHLHFD